MKINKEGYKIIGLTGVVCFLLWALMYYLMSRHAEAGLLWFGSILLVLFWFFIVAFFREPRRVKIHDAELVFAPCDGRVVVTEMVHESEYLDREMLQISIFMSITNVHMNWVPVGGTVEYFKYHPGRFLVAWHPKSSTENERTTTVVRTPRRQGGALPSDCGSDRPSYRFLYESRLEGGAKFGLRVHQVRLPHRHPSAEGYRIARGDRGSCRGIANSHRPVEVTYWRRFSRCGTYEYYTSNIASFYGGGGHYGRRPLF